jgi:hypothetical protein
LKVVKIILVLVLLFAAYVAVEVICQCRAKPPATVQTLDDYLKWQTKHRRIELQQSGGQEFVVMQGPNAGFVTSGPPVYVFDASGRLIDWTTDCGDDPRFQQKWFVGRQAREVSVEEARRHVAATRPAS